MGQEWTWRDGSKLLQTPASSRAEAVAAMVERRSIFCIVVLLTPFVICGPTKAPTPPTSPFAATRGLFGGAFNIAKEAASAGASFAQGVASEVTNVSANIATNAAKSATNVSKSVAGQAKEGAEVFAGKAKEGVEVIAEKTKEGTEGVVAKAKEGTKDAIHAVKVGAKETWVVISDPTQPIFPGTRWCGAGTKADNVTDVGVFSTVDYCCRSHDNCFDNIAVGETKHGLKNEGSFTRSHCDCDEEFYDCLKKADDLVAAKVGFTYFNVLRPQCFREERPVVRCAKTVGIAATKRCAKYEYNDRAEKKWQWFDAQDY
ncbi:uncharacterized protein LOC132200494 [Neocloeon triangulifer]|uniref:uncharacterized protein LOC132200494 n=1 Tax=Neocloeon triangulifer TaxID=2078957 RepID=UPI00286EEF20|nr:uncharacterized protein LOC132200494 [Neocloeon triangulifer]